MLLIGVALGAVGMDEGSLQAASSVIADSKTVGTDDRKEIRIHLAEGEAEGSRGGRGQNAPVTYVTRRGLQYSVDQGLSSSSQEQTARLPYGATALRRNCPTAQLQKNATANRANAFCRGALW